MTTAVADGTGAAVAVAGGLAAGGGGFDAQAAVRTEDSNSQEGMTRGFIWSAML